MFAAAFGSLEAMKLLISSGADAKAESEAGVTALHWCTGDVSKVRLLLDQGADVNKASRLGRTPLLVAAATYGTLETVKLLLQKGAEVNVVDNRGFTPLNAAANVDNTAVAKAVDRERREPKRQNLDRSSRDRFDGRRSQWESGAYASYYWRTMRISMRSQPRATAMSRTVP